MLWNGEKLEAFKSERGLRQGDSLLPYLFVLCMEVLGQQIVNVVGSKVWKPVRISRGGLVLSHLFFVDDLFLFG